MMKRNNNKNKKKKNKNKNNKNKNKKRKKKKRKKKCDDTLVSEEENNCLAIDLPAVQGQDIYRLSPFDAIKELL